METDKSPSRSQFPGPTDKMALCVGLVRPYECAHTLADSLSDRRAKKQDSFK